MNNLLDLELFEVSVVDQGANGLADIVLFKRKTEEHEMPRKKAEDVEVTKGEMPMAPGDPGMMEEDDKPEVEIEVEDGCGSKTKKSLSQDEAPVEMEATEVSKALAELSELKKSLDSAKEQVSKLLAEKAESEWLQKSKENITVGDTVEIGKALNQVAAIDSGLAEQIFGFLKAASAQVQEGALFKEVGSSTEVTPSAIDRLNNIAKELRKDEKLSEAKAFTKACELNPELVAEYRNGK